MEDTIEYWKSLALTDSLTGLPNKLALERRTHARDGWFVICDLDGFKHAQDSHPDGHFYGDRVLVEFARFLQTCVGVAARLHGDEFVVWCSNRGDALEIQQRVGAWRSKDGMVGCSVGVGKTLNLADEAMYRDKVAK